MFFAEFAQLLHPFFKHLQSSRGIVRYTCNLLDHCFVEGKCGSISDSAAKRYYNGKREEGSDRIIDDEIGSFANDMIELFDLNRLATYIEDCTRAITAKDDIFNTFHMIPGLNKDNYPTKLAKQLQTIMQAAANSYKSKRSKKAARIIPHRSAETLQQLVITVSDRINVMKDLGIQIFAQMDSECKAEKQQEYNKEYALYTQATQKFNSYCKMYLSPSFEQLHLIELLEYDAFMVKCRYGKNKYLGPDPAVYLLEESLLKIHQALDQFSQ